MKRNFRYFIGMLALAIPLCVSAQDNLQQQVNDLEGKVNRMPKISGFVQGMYLANLNEDALCPLPPFGRCGRLMFLQSCNYILHNFLLEYTIV